MYNPYSFNFASLLTVLPQSVIPLPCWACMIVSQSFSNMSKAVVLTIVVKVLGMLQHTDIERLLFSLAVKMPNF